LFVSSEAHVQQVAWLIPVLLVAAACGTVRQDIDETIPATNTPSTVGRMEVVVCTAPGEPDEVYEVVVSLPEQGVPCSAPPNTPAGTEEAMKQLVEAFLAARLAGDGAYEFLSGRGFENFGLTTQVGGLELAGKLYEREGLPYDDAWIESFEGIAGPDGSTVVYWEVKVGLTMEGREEVLRETLGVGPATDGTLRVNGGYGGWDGP
jgi:hypothetical protein